MSTAAMVSTGKAAYVLLDSREEFDRLDVPESAALDIGGNKRVLTKVIYDPKVGVGVTFQHWVDL